MILSDVDSEWVAAYIIWTVSWLRRVIATAETAVSRHIFKRSVLLQGREFVGNINLHRTSTFTVMSAKVLVSFNL